MKVYVVTVEQYYANHFEVDRVFANEEDAKAYVAKQAYVSLGTVLKNDYHYNEFEVIQH